MNNCAKVGRFAAKFILMNAAEINRLVNNQPLAQAIDAEVAGWRKREDKDVEPQLTVRKSYYGADTVSIMIHENAESLPWFGFSFTTHHIVPAFTICFNSNKPP